MQSPTAARRASHSPGCQGYRVFKETGRRAKGGKIGVVFFFRWLLKRGKRGKMEGSQLSKVAPAPESPGCRSGENHCSVLDILCSARQGTEPSGHLSPKENRNKKAAVAGSASLSVVFQTPCCTSKCHYGLCYAAGKGM